MKKIDGRLYMEDPHGSLIDASMVKPIDRLRDETVCAVMEKTFAERDRLKKFKSEIWEQIQNFVADSAKESGAKSWAERRETSPSQVLTVSTKLWSP